MTRPDLTPHQQSGVDWIRRVNRGLLADEPGLGKSRTAISAFDGGNVLVVAPSMVINGGTWKDEIERWSDHPEKYTVAPYSMLNARKKNDPDNPSNTSPTGAVRPEFAGPWDALIVDEAHYTKGRKTTWTGAVERIAKNSGAVLEMTGTPMSNWAHELYTILRVIYPDKAKRGGELGSYWRWVETWFNVTAGRFGEHARDIGDLRACYPECMDRPAFDPCEHYLRFAKDNLGENYLRRYRDDVMRDLPPLTEQQVEVPLDALQKRTYRELKRDFYTEVDDAEVIAWSLGSKNMLLDRITTSAWFLNPEGEPRGGKLDQLRFDLENRSRPTLVLAHYRDSVEACARVAELAGAKAAFIHGGTSARDVGRIVADFKSGKLDVLVGSLEKISEGLTLTVADMAIFVETSYKPSRNEQARRRIHRMGQTRPVTIRDYVAPATVDSKKRALLATKNDRQMRVLTAADIKRLL